MRTRNWGVVLYVVAALVSIAIPPLLTSASAIAPQLFPPGHQDLVRVLHAILPADLTRR